MFPAVFFCNDFLRHAFIPLTHTALASPLLYFLIILCGIPKTKFHHILTRSEFPVKQHLLALLQYLDLSTYTATLLDTPLLHGPFRSQLNFSVRCNAEPILRPQFPADSQLKLVVKCSRKFSLTKSAIIP
jgi:hypothetical protein